MVGIILIAGVPFTALAEPNSQQACPFPLANKKTVALGIFNAIAKGRQTTEKRHMYETKIEDQGDNWSVFQALKGGDSIRYFTGKNGERRETVKMTDGGGGLEMTINKCTAVISDAHLSR